MKKRQRFFLIIITNTSLEGEGAAKCGNNLMCPDIYIYIYILFIASSLTDNELKEKECK